RTGAVDRAANAGRTWLCHGRQDAGTAWTAPALTATQVDELVVPGSNDQEPPRRPPAAASGLFEGFNASEERAAWDAIQANGQRGRLILVLGPGMVDGLLPSADGIAEQWAEAYGFPFDEHNRSLPRVAQFVGSTRTPQYPRRKLLATYREYLRRNYPEQTNGSETLGEAIRKVYPVIRTEDEPHYLAAQIRGVYNYLTTNYDSFMLEALKAADREPQQMDFQWFNDPDYWRDQAGYHDLEGDSPQPSLLSLYGSERHPDAIVVTEDDYIDHSHALSPAHRKTVPKDLQTPLADSTYIFLGYDIRRFASRMLFRQLVRERHAPPPGAPKNVVVVQVEPGENARDEGAPNDVVQPYYGHYQVAVCRLPLCDLLRKLRDEIDL
ncbi:MAG: SIR2 family protein, partial [Acidobacteriota bacterium]